MSEAAGLDLMDEWGPERIVCVSDARTGMRGVLVVDNTARGMGKGGTRFAPTVSVTGTARLARVMTWKWAAVDLFHGGAKAGIRGDPRADNAEAVLRAFARKLADQIPARYVVGLDMGMTERDAAIIADELGDRGAAVGQPEELGGIAYDRIGITGYGVAEAADAALETGLAGKRVAIQGFGAVGTALARRLHELGAEVVALSTADGAVHDPDGLDVPAWLKRAAEHGPACVRTAPERTRIPLGAELAVDCDVLIPAASQDVLDADTAGRVRASLLVEGANMPSTETGRSVLAERGITVVPDFIANAGGVIAAAFAMDARYSPFPPDRRAAFELVSAKMRGNTERVLAESARLGVLPHEAALRIARDRVREAMRCKGAIPA